MSPMVKRRGWPSGVSKYGCVLHWLPSMAGKRALIETATYTKEHATSHMQALVSDHVAGQTRMATSTGGRKVLRQMQALRR